MFPGPLVHADFAAAVALAAADEDCAAARVEVSLGERECLVDPQVGAPEYDDSARNRRPWTLSPAARMTAMISSTVGGSAG